MKAREVNRRIERLGGVMLRQVGSHRRYAATYTDADGRPAKVATTVAQHPAASPRGRCGRSREIWNLRSARAGCEVASDE